MTNYGLAKSTRSDKAWWRSAMRTRRRGITGRSICASALPRGGCWAGCSVRSCGTGYKSTSCGSMPASGAEATAAPCSSTRRRSPGAPVAGTPAWRRSISRLVGLYERQGYVVYATLDGFPRGHAQFHLRRRTVAVNLWGCRSEFPTRIDFGAQSPTV